jgi:hypothetical protein
MQEVRNERKGKQEQKTRKPKRNRSERMKAERARTEKRECLPHIDGTIDEFGRSDFSATPVPLDFLFPSDFRPLSNERFLGNCFLLSAGFGLPSLALSCSCSAISVAGFGDSLAFDFAFRSKFLNFLCSLARSFLSDFSDSFLCPLPRCAFLCSCTLRLFDASFISFPLSFLFAFVDVLAHRILFLPFPYLLQSLCFSVRLPGLSVLFAKKIIFVFSHIVDSAIGTDR